MRLTLLNFAAILLVGAQALAAAPQAEPAAPSPIVSQLVDPVLLRGIEDVHLEGEFIYLPCREGERLTICSVADPEHPTILSSFTHAELGPAAGFALHGDTAYITSWRNGKLLAVDVSNKSAPKLLGVVTLGQGVLYKLAYRDGYCYVALQADKKLAVVDVRDPRQPTLVASVAVTTENDGPFSVLLRGNYALTGTIFGSRNRLAVVDIEQPTAPKLVNQIFDPLMEHTSGEVVDDFFFAVNWDVNAFLVMNIADTANPRLVAKLVDERLGNPNRAVVQGDRAYLPMITGSGVAVVDISDPMNPIFLTAFRDPSMKKTYGVAVRGDLLYVGARDGNSITVIDRHALEQKS